MITWSTVENAEKYRVYYKGRNGWTRMATTDATSYFDADVSLGTTYTYTVRCLDADASSFTSDFNQEGWKHTHYLSTPQITGFESSSQGVTIKWDRVDGAEKYRVYYKGRNGWMRMATTDHTSYLDADVSYGSTYTYTVRCVNAADNKFVSDCNSTGWKYTYLLDTPQITDFKSTGKGVQINWDKVEGAEIYRVYYKGRNGWTRMGDTSGTSFIDDDVNVGSTYRYTIRCLNKSLTKFTSDFERDGRMYTYDPQLNVPRISKVEAVSNGVEIHWDPVDGADLYRVYYRGSKGWTRMADVRGTSYVDTDVSGNSTYTYTVRCLSQGGKGFASDYDHSGTRFTLIKEPIVDNISVYMDRIEVSVFAYHCRHVRIYRKSGSGGWTRIGEVDSEEDGVFADYDVEPNKTYTYTARCVDENGVFLSYFNTSGWKQTFNVASCLPELEYFMYYGDYEGTNVALIQPKDDNKFGIKHFYLDVLYDGAYKGSFEITDEPTYIGADCFMYDRDYLLYLVGVDSNGNAITRANQIWVMTYESPKDLSVEKTGDRKYTFSWQQDAIRRYRAALLAPDGEALLESDMIKGQSYEFDLSEYPEVSDGKLIVWTTCIDEVSCSWIATIDFSEADYND